MCIFYRTYGQGACCSRPSIRGQEFCLVHNRSRPKKPKIAIHRLCAVFFGARPPRMQHGDIYDRIDALSQHIGTHDPDHISNMIQSIFQHVHTNMYINLQLYRLNQPSAQTRQAAIRSLVHFYMRVWKLRRTDIVERRLVPFQRHIRQIVNGTCPFTCTSVREMEKDQIFRWMDTHGNVYIASAPHMFHHVHLNGPWNPYNREALLEQTISRLEIQVELSQKSKDTVFHLQEPDLPTPRASILRALTYIDAQGFYTRPEWFDNISQRSVARLFAMYQHWAGHIIGTAFTDIGDLHMWLDHDPRHGHIYALGEQMMRIITDTFVDDRFRAICIFLFLLSQVQKQVASELPNWVYTAATGQ